jgi:hypothetical protein
MRVYNLKFAGIIMFIQARDICGSEYPQTDEINEKMQVPTASGEIDDNNTTVFSVAFTSLPIVC